MTRKRSNFDPMARRDDATGTLFDRRDEIRRNESKPHPGPSPIPRPPAPGVIGPTRPPFEPAPVKPPAKTGHRPMAETSLEAHRSRDREGDRLRVLDLLIQQPRTCDEIAALWGVPPNAISGRFTELAERELIRKTGERRLTRAGSTALVWHATAAGVEHVKQRRRCA